MGAQPPPHPLLHLLHRVEEVRLLRLREERLDDVGLRDRLAPDEARGARVRRDDPRVAAAGGGGLGLFRRGGGSGRGGEGAGCAGEGDAPGAGAGGGGAPRAP